MAEFEFSSGLNSPVLSMESRISATGMEEERQGRVEPAWRRRTDLQRRFRSAHIESAFSYSHSQPWRPGRKGRAGIALGTRVTTFGSSSIDSNSQAQLSHGITISGKRGAHGVPRTFRMDGSDGRRETGLAMSLLHTASLRKWTISAGLSGLPEVG